MVSRIKKIFNYQSGTMLGAASVLAVASFVSRLVGLFRDRLLASTLGISDSLDIYYGAFRLPDFVFNILVGGAISAAFIPIFAELFNQDKEKAMRYSVNIVNAVFVVGIALSLLFIIFASPIVKLIVPGFEGEKLAMTIMLSRIMFFSPVLLAVSALWSGMLQYFQRFFIASLAPIFYNAGIIIGIKIFYPIFGLVGLAWGVALGALLHLLIQLPALIGAGWRWSALLSFKDKKLWETVAVMAPRTFSLLSVQINLWVVTAFASLLSSGSIGIFYLADNIQYLPVGIFGSSLAIALFPTLAKAEASNNKEDFFVQFSEGFRFIFFLTFPMGALFFLLRAHIVRVVLGAGNFGWLDTRLTAAALGLFACSIFAQSLQPLLNRAFFSLKDTKTVTLLTIFFVIVNGALSALFIRFVHSGMWLAHWLHVSDLSDVRILGLPLAYSLAAVAQLALSAWFLKMKTKIEFKGIAKSMAKVVVATVCSIPIVYFVLYGLAEFIPTNTFLGILFQGFIAGCVGIALFLFSAILLRSEEMLLLKTMTEKKLKFRLPKIFHKENEKIQ